MIEYYKNKQLIKYERRIFVDVKFPIGKLEIPKKITKSDVTKWMEQISTYTTRLREVVDGLSEEQLQKTYREGAWNIRQLVHHIADSQVTMYHRLRLALTDDHPTVPNFDQDQWAILPDNKLPVEASLKILEGLNERIVALGNSLSEKDYKRQFTHEINGPITVGTKLKKLSWHQEHHLEHIKIALSK